MPAVTISAGYGAAGSVIARAVAEQLGVPLLDRAISSQVAGQLRVTVEEAERGELHRSFAERFFGVLAPVAGGVIGTDVEGAPAPLPVPDADLFRTRAEAIIRAALPDGAVILGRAGAAALRDEPGVLRVRLFGPPEGRVKQAALVQQVSEEVAAQRLPEVDAARAHYVRRLYGRDIDDPDLYHVQLDSTVISADGCTAAIVAAYRAYLS